MERDFLRITAALALALACACSTAGPGGDLPPGDAPDAADPGYHAMTSATPMVKGIELASAHDGWKRADCTSCHLPDHGGLTPPECVFCHGTNGAPVRAAGHADIGCGGCHAGAHGKAGFVAPADCASCHRFAPGDGCAVVNDTDVVVIGAGGGGLGAAATLARAGMKVTVLERQGRPGGYMTNFRRGDYRFEVSLHAMGGFDAGDDAAHRLFQDLGIRDRVQPVKSKTMYRTVYPDLVYETPGDIDEYRASLKATFPAEAANVDRLFDDLALGMQVMAAAEAQLEGRPEAMMQLMKDMPETVARFMGYLDKSLKEVVDEFVTDPRLFAVFTQLASYAGAEPADVASVYFLSMWNGYHNGGFYNFVGGSESISEALADVVRDNGGEVRVNTEATRIVLEEGRAKEVRTKDGSCFRARYVVSNATPAATVAMIGRESLPTEWVAAIDALKPGLPAFSVYLGVAHDYRDAFGDTHEIILQDSWDPHEVFLAGVECDPGRSMLLLITNYSVPDPTAAPAGKNVIVLTGLVGAGCHGEFAWGDHEAYKKVKDEVAAVFVDRAEAVMPGLRSHAEVIEVGSPKTMWAFSLNPNGTFAGAYPNVAQSVLNRTKQETPVPNLFLAGAWTFPGGGQQAVLGSGAAAARRILALEAATGRRPGSGSP